MHEWLKAPTSLFSGLRHLEPQIVGTRRRAATSRGHEATESAHLVPWTPTLSSTANVG